MQIISDKTASLFTCCCYLGSKVAGGSEEQIKALSDYGTNLGIAFQITDDLLDIVGSESAVGKTLGTDMEKCKLTLPVIHLLENSKPGDRAVIIKKLQSADRGYINGLLQESGSVAHTRSVAGKLCGKSLASLEILGDSPSKHSLIDIANGLTARVSYAVMG